MGRRRLTDEDIAGIRTEFAAGLTMKELAAKYGASVDWTRRIVRGEMLARDKAEAPPVQTVCRRAYMGEPGRMLLLGLCQAELVRCYADAAREKPRALMRMITLLRDNATRLAIERLEHQALPDAPAGGPSSSVTMASGLSS